VGKSKSPRSGRQKFIVSKRGFCSIARSALSVFFAVVDLGFRCAPPQADFMLPTAPWVRKSCPHELRTSLESETN
jgi:hypothetical protein